MIPTYMMPLFPKKQQAGILIFLIILFPGKGLAQRVFVNAVGGVSRSYLYHSNTNDDRGNKAVVIILHGNGNTARDAFANAEWKSLKEPAIFIFPNAFKNNWNCKDQVLLENDVNFLKFILSETYNNFRHNRNRVFIVSDKENECLGQKFQQQYPRVITGVENWTQGSDNASLVTVSSVQNLLAKTISADTTYSLWDDPVVRKKMDPVDSLKGYRLHNRLVLEVRYGGFAMLGSVRTGVSDGTYAKLYNSRSFLDIHLTKWMNDSIAWFMDVGRLKVPQTQEVTGSGIVKSGGGMIMPLTLGFKYALPRIRSHPYFLLGSGVMQVMVFGGKMNPASMTSGARPNLNSEMRMVFHTTIGTGIDLRFTKRFIVGAHLRYMHSANFESAGEVDAIRGFNLNVGLGYIINANSMRKLPFPLSNKK